MEIITRKEAIESGAKFYFTGKPCKYGHTSKRLVSNKTCYLCNVVRVKNWKKENKNRFMKSKKIRSMEKNDLSIKNASNNRQEITINDIDTVTSKDDSGDYIYTAQELSLMLKRTYFSIFNIRQRYAKNKKEEPKC